MWIFSHFDTAYCDASLVWRTLESIVSCRTFHACPIVGVVSRLWLETLTSAFSRFFLSNHPSSRGKVTTIKILLGLRAVDRKHYIRHTTDISCSFVDHNNPPCFICTILFVWSIGHALHCQYFLWIHLPILSLISNQNTTKPSLSNITTYKTNKISNTDDKYHNITIHPS